MPLELKITKTKYIKKAKIAYRLGIRSGISPDTYSAYLDMSKWSGLFKFGRREVKMFLLGWEEGYASAATEKKKFYGTVAISSDDAELRRSVCLQNEDLACVIN